MNWKMQYFATLVQIYKAVAITDLVMDVGMFHHFFRWNNSSSEAHVQLSIILSVEEF